MWTSKRPRDARIGVEHAILWEHIVDTLSLTNGDWEVREGDSDFKFNVTYHLKKAAPYTSSLYCVYEIQDGKLWIGHTSFQIADPKITLNIYSILAAVAEALTRDDNGYSPSSLTIVQVGGYTLFPTMSNKVTVKDDAIEVNTVTTFRFVKEVPPELLYGP